MFRAIILPIFRSNRLYVTACDIMHPRCCRPPAGNIVVELTGIINKPLLLHLVGCLYYYYQWCTVKQISDNEIYLIKYIKSVLWRVAKRLSYIEDARCLNVKYRFNTILSCTPGSLKSCLFKLHFSNKILYVFFRHSYAWYETRRSYPHWFQHSNTPP